MQTQCVVNKGSSGWQGQLPDLSERQFAEWKALLAQRLSLDLSLARRAFLSSRLRQCMHALGEESYEGYRDYLVARSVQHTEWRRLLDHLTIHETSFFRHQPSYDLLSEFYLPWWQGRQEGARGTQGTLQIWSAACATGEEAYSLAMTVEEYRRRHGVLFYYGVTATDISPASIAFARRGVYGGSSVARLDGRTRSRYFTAEDGAAQWRVGEGLRSRVCFIEKNLQDVASAPFGHMDIIFCQNVLIYFEQERRLKIVESMLAHLKPGGLLVLGNGEITNWKCPSLTRVSYPEITAFQKRQD